MPFDRTRLPEPAGYFASQGLTLKGPHRSPWQTTACSFHGGSDSMRVNVINGAFVCMNCGVKGGDVLAYEMQASSLEFVAAAKALGITCIGLLGREGGKLKAECDIAIVVPSQVTARIQEAHILIGHSLCGAVEQQLGLVSAD